MRQAFFDSIWRCLWFAILLATTSACNNPPKVTVVKDSGSLDSSPVADSSTPDSPGFTDSSGIVDGTTADGTTADSTAIDSGPGADGLTVDSTALEEDAGSSDGAAGCRWPTPRACGDSCAECCDSSHCGSGECQAGFCLCPAEQALSCEPNQMCVSCCDGTDCEASACPGYATCEAGACGYTRLLEDASCTTASLACCPGTSCDLTVDKCVACLETCGDNIDWTDTSNILSNPGFELGTASPDGWTLNQRSTNSLIEWDSSFSHSGGRSVRISNADATETGNVYQIRLFDPPLPAGSRVTFSAHTFSDGGRPQLVFNLFSGAIRQDSNLICADPSEDFRAVYGEVVAENPTDRMILYLCNYRPGTVWWDNALVTVWRAPQSVPQSRPVDNTTLATLSTDDGLNLGFAANGGVINLSLTDTDVCDSNKASGLWIKPYAHSPIPVTGTVMERSGTIIQEYQDPEQELSVSATFSSEGDSIRCDGFVEDLVGKDRAVDIWFALPMGNAQWTWGESIRSEFPLPDEAIHGDRTTFMSLSHASSGHGVALAIDANTPADFDFFYDPEMGFGIRYRFGLSPAAAGDLSSRAPFSFVIYRIDGNWGLRDAARRYYGLFPQAFVKRAPHEGLWLFGTPRIDLPDPQHYAFREGSQNYAVADDSNGILTCPYLIPGQREIKNLDTLPADQEEAMAVFATYEPPLEEDPRGWGSRIKEIITSSCLEDRCHRTVLNIRNTNWGGNSITFPLNANPALFAGEQTNTVAKVLFEYADYLNTDYPNIDGIYVDSLGSWGSYNNQRRDHFAFASTPLSYDLDTGQPLIANRFTLLEFLWGLGNIQHPQGKLVFGNGLHPNRRFHFFAVDVLGVEGHTHLEQKRVMAFQKPFLLLIYNIHDDPAQMEHYYHLCTLYGIYPSFGNMRVFETEELYAPVASLNARFVPVLRTITAAGWQPVTHAHSSADKVLLERWGEGPDPVYLTVYNSTSTQQSTTLTVDAGLLGLSAANLGFEDILNGGTWTAPSVDGSAQIELPVPEQEVRVLKIQ